MMRRASSAVLATLCFVSLYPSIAAAQANIPSQFVAKQYTDGLGRIPDPSGWQNGINNFTALGCSPSSLQSFGSLVLTSSEYQAIPYDNAARLLTLYRTALNREPDTTSFNSNLANLNGGGSWSAMVSSVFASAEFQQLAPSICNPPSDFSYSFGAGPVIDLPVSGSGFRGNGAQLQSVLNGTPSGQTVWLAQKAVIRLSSPLVIPAGVTVATSGNPKHNSYALMARLVRTAAFNSAAVKLKSGAKLRNTWVDGQRGQIGFDATRINLELEGGSGTEVSNCMITNTSGGTNLKTLGTGEGLPCASANVLSNLVTGYSTSHFNFQWSDGLTNACENAEIYDNEVIDATDVGIVVFDSGTAVQKSQIHHNRILNSGNSAYGGIVADPWMGAGIQHDFTGTSVYDNTLWTGSAHYEIVLSLGTRAWFGTNSATGIGASFSTNNTGSFSANANTGIVVSGMLNAYVQSNNLSLNLANYCSCPHVTVAAAVMAGYASGSIQHYTDVDVPGCI